MPATEAWSGSTKAHMELMLTAGELMSVSKAVAMERGSWTTFGGAELPAVGWP